MASSFFGIKQGAPTKFLSELLNLTGLSMLDFTDGGETATSLPLLEAPGVLDRSLRVAPS